MRQAACLQHVTQRLRFTDVKLRPKFTGDDEHVTADCDLRGIMCAQWGKSISSFVYSRALNGRGKGFVATDSAGVIDL